IDLQVSAKDNHFNHRHVLAILAHPYAVAADAASPNAKRKEILKHNWVHIPNSFLATEVDLHRIIFQQLTGDAANVTRQIIDYLRSIVTAIGSLKTIGEFDKEYAYHFVRFFNQLENVVGGQSAADGIPDKKELRKRTQASLKSFIRLFRQLVRSQKIPFAGEPLKGMQVMGVLETRNLDFKNIFILSLNE